MVKTVGKSDLPQFEYWTNRWKNGDTPWHRDGVCPLLEKNQDVILAGKQDAQVYLPMCGKAPDLKWFYGKGHRVVGVEYIEEVARGFFVDNSLPFDEAECPVLKCKILQSADKRLRIFVCSVFDFNKSCAGAMDIVWDRGALSSIDVELRGRQYCSLLLLSSFFYPIFTQFWVSSFSVYYSRGTSIPGAELISNKNLHYISFLTKRENMAQCNLEVQHLPLKS
ncbi:hypothetical protein HPB47_011323 [Ixodes persulcatus]|uniref:Uncharacterized protein n=1 Tax=Ixodes persulcatus TaxID=34615 RepID=A0AC60NWL1_IXOPE|nr:hypothetical protein HPB47_011323 [Ixodes persulcatus]